MAKAWVHAESSARRFGGIPEDYVEVHNLMDSSKEVLSDNRHRVLTHNSWFVCNILERVFGVAIKNSEGKMVPVRSLGEQHVLEDFGGRFIPTAQDFLQSMVFEPWMNNGKGVPPSYPRTPGTSRAKRAGSVFGMETVKYLEPMDPVEIEPEVAGVEEIDNIEDMIID